LLRVLRGSGGHRARWAASSRSRARPAWAASTERSASRFAGMRRPSAGRRGSRERGLPFAAARGDCSEAVTKMTAPGNQDRKRAPAADSLAARAEFHTLLASLSDDDWRRRSRNPGWNNGEILFHMALGFFLLPTLLPMLRLLGRLPRGATRPFAAL